MSAAIVAPASRTAPASPAAPYCAMGAKAVVPSLSLTRATRPPSSSTPMKSGMRLKRCAPAISCAVCSRDSRLSAKQMMPPTGRRSSASRRASFASVTASPFVSDCGVTIKSWQTRSCAVMPSRSACARCRSSVSASGSVGASVTVGACVSVAITGCVGAALGSGSSTPQAVKRKRSPRTRTVHRLMANSSLFYDYSRCRAEIQDLRGRS